MSFSYQPVKTYTKAPVNTLCKVFVRVGNKHLKTLYKVHAFFQYL